jgi:hypothetical protein
MDLAAFPTFGSVGPLWTRHDRAGEPGEPLSSWSFKVSSFLGHSDPKITVKAYYSGTED